MNVGSSSDSFGYKRVKRMRTISMYDLIDGKEFKEIIRHRCLFTSTANC